MCVFFEGDLVSRREYLEVLLPLFWTLSSFVRFCLLVNGVRIRREGFLNTLRELICGNCSKDV